MSPRSPSVHYTLHPIVRMLKGKLNVGRSEVNDKGSDGSGNRKTNHLQ